MDTKNSVTLDFKHWEIKKCKKKNNNETKIRNRLDSYIVQCDIYIDNYLD